MKILILLFVLISSSIVSAKSLKCESRTNVEGWDGGNTNEKVQVSAEVKEKKLVHATLDGAYKTDYVDELLGKVSTNGKWLKFKYFEDAWCWFSLTLPENFAERSKFPGFIDVKCEGYSRESFEVTCNLK